MASTTPTSAPPSSDRQRSSSRTRHPTTPLRAASRTSLRASTTTPAAHNSSQSTSSPLDALEPAFAEFSDSMADLEANMMHLQILQESLNRFNDNFGAFLYGMNMNAFTVDFTEAPGAESFKRAKEAAERSGQEAGRQFGFRGGGGPHDMPGGGHVVTGGGLGRDVDATFLTSDTSFVENPPTPRTATTSRTKMAPPPPPSAMRTPTRKAAETTGTVRGGREVAPSTTRSKAPPVVRGTRASQLAAERRETIARGRGKGSSLLK